MVGNDDPIVVDAGLFCYVATLCQKGGAPERGSVKAVVLNGFSSINDARKYVEDNSPSWNLKEIRKLYNSDFE